MTSTNWKNSLKSLNQQDEAESQYTLDIFRRNQMKNNWLVTEQQEKIWKLQWIPNLTSVSIMMLVQKGPISVQEVFAGTSYLSEQEAFHSTQAHLEYWRKQYISWREFGRKQQVWKTAKVSENTTYEEKLKELSLFLQEKMTASGNMTIVFQCIKEWCHSVEQSIILKAYWEQVKEKLA